MGTIVMASLLRVVTLASQVQLESDWGGQGRIVLVFTCSHAAPAAGAADGAAAGRGDCHQVEGGAGAEDRLPQDPGEDDRPLHREAGQGATSFVYLYALREPSADLQSLQALLACAQSCAM